MSKQPEALRLAYALEHCIEVGGSSSDAMGLTDRSQATVDSAAAELRRLHDLNGELLEAVVRARQWLQGNDPGRAQYLSEVIAKAGKQP